MRRELRVSAEFLQWFGLLGAALTWTVQNLRLFETGK